VDKTQYQELSQTRPPRFIPGVAELKNRTPRTLLLGYDVDRNTVHVYIGYDGLIHVLRYSARTVGSGQPLILSHSAGLDGGLADPRHYTPSKRAYPESCDAEFCRLLQRHGVDIFFTCFTDGVDAERRNQYGWFSGLMYDEALMSVSLAPALLDDPAMSAGLPDKANLAGRLACQAALETGTPFVQLDDGSVQVAAGSAEKVLVHARSLLQDAASFPLFGTDAADALLEALFGVEGARYAHVADQYAEAGDVRLQLDARDVAFRTDAGLTPHAPAASSTFWREAVSGTLHGRPFFATRDKHHQVRVRLREFGNPVVFLAASLQAYLQKH
jgi:hypothetical protein